MLSYNISFIALKLFKLRDFWMFKFTDSIQSKIQKNLDLNMKLTTRICL
jgi:hypothetical protein